MMMYASFLTATDLCVKRKPENNGRRLVHMVTGVIEESVLMSGSILLYSTLISHAKVCCAGPITAVWELLFFLLNQQLKLHCKFKQVSLKVEAIRTN